MKRETAPDTIKKLMRHLLPEGTQDYFELTHILKDKGPSVILEEKNLALAEYSA